MERRDTSRSGPAPDPARSLLEAGLSELGLRTEESQVQALLTLARLLHVWGQRLNLTGHRDTEQIVHRLILDAAALVGVLDRVESLADLGSGAGFPGLPIAVLRPECSLTLVESRGRRHHFQRTAVRDLGLGNVRLELGRAEQVAARPHAAVISQAMAAPAEALPWMLPWARPGGLLLLPGSERAPKPPSHPELVWEERRTYRVPCGGPERTLWRGRRVGS